MKVEVLFPEICNVAGDHMNVPYLCQCCPDLELVETDLKTRPRFLDEDVALVYLGSTTEKGLQLIVESLSPHLAAIKERIEAGQRILATGNALDALGGYIDSDKAPRMTGLGLLPTHAEYKMMKRHNSFFLGTFEDMEIVGFQSLFGHTWGAPEENALFTVVRGVGRNENTSLEGFRYKNLMATYLIGPLLVLNPPFCKWLLRQMGQPDTLAFEDAAMDSYRRRLEEFHEENRPWKY